MSAQHRRRIPMAHPIAVGAAALASTLIAGCATVSTLRSGTADTFFDRPPYYSGQRLIERGAVLYLPVQFRVADGALFGPDLQGQPLRSMLAEMNAYLESLSPGPRRASADSALAGASAASVLAGASADSALAGAPPYVEFGCEILPDDECVNADPRRPLRLAVRRPSRAWVEAARVEAQRAGAERVLVIGLQIGNHLPRQRNWRGDKEVQLGTGYVTAVPWLTALDRPANVLQITGALVDLDGRVVRAGVEGLIVRRTNIILSGFGIQALISDDDVERARTLRREDLPGQPLVWQVALGNLVGELTAQPGLAGR
jgi:hypothetical protein